MLTNLPCGCRVDDAVLSTIHEPDGKHYPIGTSPVTFCKKCDLYRPCLCDQRFSTQVYVAASYTRDRLRAKAFIERLLLASFAISHDWTDEMPPPVTATAADRIEISRQQAADDLSGAIDCDTLVLLASNGMRGAWIEVGAALSTGANVLIVGELRDAEHFVFLALPNVYRVADEDAALAWLEGRR